VRAYRGLATLAIALLAPGTLLLPSLQQPGRTARDPTPIVLPPGFAAEIFADGLGAPRALAVDPAGTLLVSIPGQGRSLLWTTELPVSP